jgi:hypothetical protein
MNTPLIAGFISATPAQEIAARRDSFERWMEIEGVLGKGTPRPIISVTVTVGAFEHLGQPGVLTLTFFQGSLQKTTFYPSDLAGYLQALRAQGIEIPSNGSVYTAPHTRISRGVAKSALYAGREFVSWSDEELDEAERRWNKQNTSLLERLLGRGK